MIGTSPIERTEAGEALEPEHELLTINMGPHHPATHGVLRLLVSLEGEVVLDLKPIIGYVHTGIEKSCEDKSYWKVIPFVERMDYLSYFFNMQAFCGAVEKLLELEIPPRAKYLRMIHLELNRIHSHLVWLGTTALDLGAISMFWYCFRERDTILDLFEMSTGPADAHPLLPGRRRLRGHPGRLRARRCAPSATRCRRGSTSTRRCSTATRSSCSGPRGSGSSRASGCSSSASPGRCCAPPASPGTCARPTPTSPTATSTSRSRSGRSATATTATGSGCPRCASRCGSSSSALDGLPEGPWIADDRKVVLPPRDELSTSMEALIHHFKLVTEGFRVPPGEVYYPIESPRGELGCFVLADGSAKPARVHFRDPSFVNLQALRDMCVGGYIADLIANLGDARPDPRGDRPVSEPRQLRRSRSTCCARPTS